MKWPKLTEEDIKLVQQMEERFPSVPKSWPQWAGYVTWAVVVLTLLLLYFIVRAA